MRTFRDSVSTLSLLIFVSAPLLANHFLLLLIARSLQNPGRENLIISFRHLAFFARHHFPSSSSLCSISVFIRVVVAAENGIKTDPEGEVLLLLN
jgi:hypothetical protein